MRKLIASENLPKEYPEIFHYTDSGGFQGILSTNTLWATHYRDLNDTTEVQFIREPLQAAITGSFERLLRLKDPLATRVRPGSAPGIAKDLVDSLYHIGIDRPEAYLHTEPFITSFCSHRDSYEQQHGLLSQWRGYGGTGGFCIVFDTELLGQLLAAETRSCYYVNASIQQVAYASEDAALEALFPDLISSCKVFLHEFVERNPKQPFENIFTSFLRGATVLKHQAFREEAEIRVVAVPGNRQAFEEEGKENGNHDSRPLKPVNRRATSGGTSRYIILFDALSAGLPIQRVIVGPSRHQSQRADLARELLDPSIPLVLSETPYLPPT